MLLHIACSPMMLVAPEAFSASQSAADAQDCQKVGRCRIMPGERRTDVESCVEPASNHRRTRTGSRSIQTLFWA